MNICSHLFIVIVSFLLSTFTHSCPEVITQKDINTFEKIQAVLDKCDLNSVEDMLSILDPELRRRYTLVYKSRGLGFSSAQFPRVIYSGFQNEITLTHDSIDNKRNSHLIEFALMNLKSKKLDFGFIQFDPKKYKYFLTYMTGCLWERNDYTDYSIEQIIEFLKGSLSEYQLTKMVTALNIKYNFGKLELKELLSKMKDEIYSKVFYHQMNNFNRICQGINYLNKEIEEMKQDCSEIAKSFDGTDPARFSLATMQSSHILLHKFFFDYLGFDFDHWMQSRQDGGFYGNNLNASLSLIDIIHHYFDFQKTDPYFYELSEKVSKNYWPSISDFPSRGIWKSPRDRNYPD